MLEFEKVWRDGTEYDHYLRDTKIEEKLSLSPQNGSDGTSLGHLVQQGHPRAHGTGLCPDSP